MKNVIVLPNRYNDKVELHKIKDNLYQLILENYHCRIGYDSDEDYKNGNYNFIDPSGGPFIYIGYKIEDMNVSKIYTNGEKLLIEFNGND